MVPAFLPLLRILACVVWLGRATYKLVTFRSNNSFFCVISLAGTGYMFNTRLCVKRHPANLVGSGNRSFCKIDVVGRKYPLLV
jgi:hypothetical protein